MSAPAQPQSPPMYSFADSIARFLVLTPKGQLFALTDLRIAEDYSKVVPSLCDADFHIATSIATRLEESNLTLVLQPREQTNTYFLTRLPGQAAERKPIKVFEEASEIIETAVNNGRYPVIALSELHRLLVQARSRMGNGVLPAPAIPLPIRYLALRPTVPEDWLKVLSALTLANATDDPDKSDLLQDRLNQLSLLVKRHMVRRYLVECLWTDAAHRRIGRMSPNEDGSDFRSFISGASDLMRFCDSLDTRSDGRFELQDGVANVIPRMVDRMPWTAPTLHVYDAATRERFGFQEHYSLYAGLRELAVMGAPVLVHSKGVMDSVIPVALLKAMGGAGMSPSETHEFPIRKVVWKV